MDGWNAWNNWCAAGMGFGWLFPVTLLGLLVWGGITLARRPTPFLGGDSALETLRRRYAKGELAREEFESMRRTIIG